MPAVKDISYTNARQTYSDTSCDLATPDGLVTSFERSANRRGIRAQVRIEGIRACFAGWDSTFHVYFNVKSTLSQTGVNGVGTEMHRDEAAGCVTLTVDLTAVSHLGVLMLDEIRVNSRIGKLFCRAPARRVADPAYLSRRVGRVDRMGKPLLHLGEEGEDWWAEQRDGRTIFHVSLRQGVVSYGGDVAGIIPTVGRGLRTGRSCKQVLRMHQEHDYDQSRLAVPGRMLMVRTKPLYIRNCFARVAADLLPEGLHTCTSDLMEPVDTSSEPSALREEEEGRTFCFYGQSTQFLESIPLELYQLEAWKEHSYFEDGLRQSLDAQPATIFDAFRSIPDGREAQSCCYVVKKEQLRHLRTADWVSTHPVRSDYPGITQPEEQRESVRLYLRQQCSYGMKKNKKKQNI